LIDIYGRARGGGGRGGGSRGGSRGRSVTSRSGTGRSRSSVSPTLSPTIGSTLGSKLGSAASLMDMPSLDLGSSDIASRLGRGQGGGQQGGGLPPGLRPDLSGRGQNAPPYYLPEEEQVDEEGMPLDLEQIGDAVAAEFGSDDPDDGDIFDGIFGFDDEDPFSPDDAFGSMSASARYYQPARMTRIEQLANMSIKGSHAAGREMVNEIRADLARDGESRITPVVFKALRRHYQGDAVFPKPFSRKIEAPHRFNKPTHRGLSSAPHAPHGARFGWNDQAQQPGASSTFVDGLKVGAGVTAGVIGALAAIGLVAKAFTT